MEIVATCLVTFAAAAVSGFVPILSSEVLILGAAAVAPPSIRFALPLVMAAGQMAGKVVVYMGAVATAGRVSNRVAGRIQRIAAFTEGRPVLLGVMVLASGCFGMPPFYAVTLAAGLLRLRLVPFLVLGFVGFAVRFHLVLGAGDALSRFVR